MKITLVGTGNMGSAFASQLSKAGHEVRVTGRDQSKAIALAAQYGGIKAFPADQAVAGNEIIILATGYSDAITALRGLGNIDGKTIIDVTNPLTADYMGLEIGHTTSAAEEIARAFPAANVVKAFNTVFAQVLNEGPAFPNGQTASIFIAGDDESAKHSVHELAKSMDWNTVDAGGLKNARYLEAVAGLNIYLGYGAGLGTQITPAWLSR